MSTIAQDIVSGYYNYYKLKWTDSLSMHVKQQVLWRMDQCIDCVAARRCKSCTCKVPHMFFSATKSCKNGKWGKMLSPIKWEAFKARDTYRTFVHQVTQEGLKDGRIFDFDHVDDVDTFQSILECILRYRGFTPNNGGDARTTTPTEDLLSSRTMANPNSETKESGASEAQG